jgi:zinc protease
MTESNASFPRLDVHSLPGPETIHRRVLKNGIVTLARENFASPSIVFAGRVAGGALVVPPVKAGLADLTASALMRGTAKRDFQAIYESVESIGASLSIGASMHGISFFGKSLAEDIALMLELLTESFYWPIFPSIPVERLRAEKLTSIAIRDQDTSARAEMAFHQMAFPDHPYRIPVEGTSETVKPLQIEDLKDYHHRHVGPKGMLIAIVGALEAERSLDHIESAFAGWENTEQEFVPEVPSMDSPPGLLRENIVLEGKMQSDVVMGAPGPSRFNPRYLAASLGNNIFGRFGLYGRIGDRVREESGLAYYVYSSLAGGPGPGAWQVIAGVNPANVELAIDLIRDEIRKIIKEGVTAEEVRDNQANFIGRLPLQLETNEGVASALVHIERYQLGLDYYQRYPEIIASITPEHVHEAVECFLHPDQLAIAVAGPSLQEGK